MIRMENVHKSYHTRFGPKRVLQGVSFTLNRGESLGVMGRNGAGKSTLTRLVGGLDKPDSGTITAGMSISWPLGYSGAFQPSLTGADNVRFIARIYERDEAEMIASVEEFADLGEYFRMPVSTYSMGMRARLGFGASLAVDFDCYLVDEMTAAGDHRFTVKSQRALLERRARGSLLMISHDGHALDAYCDRGAILDGGKLTFYDNIPAMVEAYNAL